MGTTNTLKVIHKQAYKTEAEWINQDPVLDSGVLAFSSDKGGAYKIGDGTSEWSALSYNNLQPWVATTSGSGSAYTVTLSPAPQALYTGMIITIIPHTTSTSVSATLNVNGLGAKYIRQRGYTSGTLYSPSTSSFLTANKPVTLVYNGTYWVDLSYTKPTWSDVQSKPSSFTPSSHTHTIANVTGLQTALDEKSDANITKNPDATDGDIISTHLTVGSRSSGDIGNYSFSSGSGHVVSAYYSAALGGTSNEVKTSDSAVIGGNANIVTGGRSVVIGGRANTVSGDKSVVIGGDGNTVDATYNSVVIGGSSNKASGYLGAVALGGEGNNALSYQVKIGHYALDGTAGQGGGTKGDAFIIGNGSNNTKSNAFRVSYAGAVYGKSAFNSTGADYAEYFEWANGNPDNEDRRGLFVTLDGDKVKIASPDDEIIGIVSANPSLIGNSYDDTWQGMYLTDMFGRPLTQTVHHEAKYEEIEIPDVDENGNELETTHIEKVLINDAYDAEEYIINPDYDSEQEYVPRSKRKEWAVVGMFGQLVVVDDGTCVVNGYCKPTLNGKATTAETGYRVIKRIDDTHIKVLFK